MLTLVASWNLATSPLGPTLGLLQILAGESERVSAVWMVVAPVLTLVNYALTRSRFGWPALWFQVLSMVVLVAAAMFISPDRSATALALVLPVLAAALCFRLREVLAVQGFAFAVLLTYGVLLPPHNKGLLIGTGVVLLAAFLITAATVRLREQLLAERTREVKAEIARARVLLDAGFDGTADVSDGRLVRVSDGFSRALGCRPEDLEGKPLDEAFATLRADGPRVEEAVPFLDASGSLRYLAVLRQELPSEAGTDEVIAVRDETQQQLHKSNLLFTDRMVAVGTLASGVAHEINNALMTLSGHSEVGPMAIGRGDLDRATRSFAAIQDASDRIATCVAQLRRFGKQSEPTSETIDLNGVVESTLQLAQHRLRHVAKVEVALDPDLPPCRGTDAGVGQILMNLLLNALDATGGCARPVIRTETLRDGDWVIVRVADNGPGVPPQHAERIFQPFFTLKDQQGSGLGLPISASLAVRMGGTLRLEPSAQGARFALRLPIGEPDSAPVRPVPVQARARDTDRILLVDDEPRVLDVIEQLLHPAVVTRAGSVEAARAAWTPDYDLVLSDLVMPGETGLGFRSWLAAEHPEALDRFVLMTGSAVGMEDAVAALPAQQRVLSKPLKQSELLLLLAALRRA